MARFSAPLIKENLFRWVKPHPATGLAAERPYLMPQPKPAENPAVGGISVKKTIYGRTLTKLSPCLQMNTLLSSKA